MSTEATFIARSKRNRQTNAFILGSCTVVTGAGDIHFQDGEAIVTADQAVALQQRGDVDVYKEAAIEDLAAAPVGEVPHVDGASGTIGLKQSSAPGGITVTNPNSDIVQGGEQSDAVKAALADANTGDSLNSEDGSQQLTDEQQAQLDAAREHLRSEGLDVPEPTAVDLGRVEVPQGFETVLEGGDARCLAAKTDGSQCANAAKGETHACGLEKHQESVAERTRK